MVGGFVAQAAHGCPVRGVRVQRAALPQHAHHALLLPLSGPVASSAGRGGAGRPAASQARTPRSRGASDREAPPAGRPLPHHCPPAALQGRLPWPPAVEELHLHVQNVHLQAQPIVRAFLTVLGAGGVPRAHLLRACIKVSVRGGACCT